MYWQFYSNLTYLVILLFLFYISYLNAYLIIDNFNQKNVLIKSNTVLEREFIQKLEEIFPTEEPNNDLQNKSIFSPLENLAYQIDIHLVNNVNKLIKANFSKLINDNFNLSIEDNFRNNKTIIYDVLYFKESHKIIRNIIKTIKNIATTTDSEKFFLNNLTTNLVKKTKTLKKCTSLQKYQSALQFNCILKILKMLENNTFDFNNCS